MSGMPSGSCGERLEGRPPSALPMRARSGQALVSRPAGGSATPKLLAPAGRGHDASLPPDPRRAARIVGAPARLWLVFMRVAPVAFLGVLPLLVLIVAVRVAVHAGDL